MPLNYIYKLVLQIIERGFLTYFVYYMNMDITFFLGIFFFFYRYIIAHTFKNIKTLSPGTSILGEPGKKQREILN